MHTEFWWGNILRNVSVEDREADGRKTLRRILGSCKVGRWRELDKDRVERRSLLLTLLNTQVPSQNLLVT
jgi:hypothetical protein